MPDLDHEFLHEVKMLSSNGTLARVLSMMDAEAVMDWRRSVNTEDRERAWFMVQAIHLVNAKIKSLSDDEKVTAFNNKIRRNS